MATRAGTTEAARGGTVLSLAGWSGMCSSLMSAAGVQKSVRTRRTVVTTVVPKVQSMPGAR